jgi:hypothetical protein
MISNRKHIDPDNSPTPFRPGTLMSSATPAAGHLAERYNDTSSTSSR